MECLIKWPKKKGKSVSTVAAENVDHGEGWVECGESLNYSTNMRPLYADFSVFS